MKTPFILILFFCILAATHSQTQAQSVDYPIYSAKSTTTREITRIEQNDTATILYMEVYHQPNYWCKISSKTTLHGSTTGKNYKLLYSKGFELDKEVYMPASGNVSCQLFFEPLDKKEQKISFIGGQEKNDTVIENLELNENNKKKPICCHIYGTVIDRPQTSRLILCTDLSMIRTGSWLSIPVHSGKFDYKLYTNTKEKYLLIYWDDYSMKGIMYDFPFFAENGDIQMTLKTESGEDSRAYEIKTNTPLTTEMLAYEKLERAKYQFKDIRAEEKVLEIAGEYYTEIYQSFWKKFEVTKDPNERDKLYKERDELEKNKAFYTDAAKTLLEKSELRYDSLIAWRLQHIAKHPSLASLYLLQETAERTKYREKDITPCIEVYRKVFEKKFAEHPVGKQMQEFITSLNLKVGNPYINFSAPNLQGDMIKISDVIHEKVALIDFWASWCGPCRRGSISMIPVYEKYKDKGFTIVGIAREKNPISDMKSAIQKDGYPWLNLVEMNDKLGIWSKYGISNAAGSTFLVDRNGRILAINPSAEEVKVILEKTL